MDSNAPQYIAFYGSLMQPHGMQRDLGIEDQLELIGPCEIFGVLYDLGDYPGLVASESERVHAELYRIKNPAVLVQLDEYEDYRPENEAGSLYLRRLVRLARPDVDCWVYFYNREVFDGQRVVSGKWVFGRQRGAE